MTKIFICPYFGEFPEWMGKYIKHAEKLKQYGYDFLIDTDLEGFKKRVKTKLGIDCDIQPGTGKVWDYRCALGYLYEEEIKDYQFWGHTDFDCVYGDVSKWVTDEFLKDLDLHSNHNTYVCGCWSLYRNTDKVNKLFFNHPDWQMYMSYGEPNGWVEGEFSRLLEKSGLRYKYTLWQNKDFNDMSHLSLKGDSLFDGEEEIMMAHFRRTKIWPL